MGQAMPADKLGRYMTSEAFLAGANAAVARAVRQLEQRSIAPTYVQRSRSQQPTTVASPRDVSAPEKG